MTTEEKRRCHEAGMRGKEKRVENNMKSKLALRKLVNGAEIK